MAGKHDEDSRGRILDALVLVVYERGYADTTVTEVCARASVARGTFYEAFEDLPGCFLTLMDDAYRRAHMLITQAFAEHEQWRDGVRAALVSLLAFFDAQPRLARVWLIETLGAGTWALERRERHLASLTSMIIECWPAPEDRQLSPLTAACAMESILAMIRAHLLTCEEEPLIGLLASMMSLVVTVYLGPDEGAIELQRCQAVVRERSSHGARVADVDVMASVALPPTLRNPRAHRARACLRYLAHNPDASNREIAVAVGINRDDQISTTLARLARMDLVVKRRGRPGGPNAWWLSARGESIAHALLEPDSGLRAASAGVTVASSIPRVGDDGFDKRSVYPILTRLEGKVKP